MLLTIVDIVLGFGMLFAFLVAIYGDTGAAVSTFLGITAAALLISALAISARR